MAFGYWWLPTARGLAISRGSIETFAILAATAVGGALALHVFYQAVRTNWPTVYMSAADAAGHLVSKGPVRYLAYRALPVFAVAFFIAGSLRAAGQPDGWPVLGMALIHAGWTNGRGLWSTLRGGDQFPLWSTAILHGAAIVVAITAALAALPVARWERSGDLLPKVDEISTALWTGAIAAVLGAFIVRISTSPRDAFEASRRSIPDGLWEAARSYALENRADPALIKAIMLVENLQRPPWLRALESIKRRLGLPGTYGIMQVRTPGVTDDESSIRAACEEHLRGARPLKTEYGPDPDSLRALISRHNPDPVFIDYVQMFYWQLAQEEAQLRARVQVKVGPDGVLVATNEGRDPAREVYVFFVTGDGNAQNWRRAGPVNVGGGEKVPLMLSTIAGTEELPKVEQRLVRYLDLGIPIILVKWRNDDSTEALSEWRVVWELWRVDDAA